MKLSFIFGAFFCQLVVSVMADGDSLNLTLINELPVKREEAILASKPKWDQPSVSSILEGYVAYDKALSEMIKALVTTYYGSGPGALKAGDVDPMAEQMFAVANNRQKALNPTGEWLGAESSLDVPRRVTREIEDLIVNMVNAITEGDHTFDMQAWEKRWNKAEDKAHSDS